MLDKTYSPRDIEADLYEAWEKEGFQRSCPESSSAPYAIMMPPPNVTGSLHMGHALTFTLQDILIRYHRMQGRDVLWQPGTDHAGIATQMVVERQLAAEGVSRHDLGRQHFLDRVWAWKEQSGDTIVRQLRRLGALPDWERARFTMDEGLSQAVRHAFVSLHKDGLIYRAKRLVNWDPKLHTAISDLEVESRDIKGSMWHIRYPVDDLPDTYIVVATTRPETMLGDTGVAVHPDDPRYCHLIGKKVRLPLSNRLIPVVADEHADPEKGTGAVKITPAHDFNDFEVGKRVGLEIINIFDASARILSGPIPVLRFMEGMAQPALQLDGTAFCVEMPQAFVSLDRFEAREKIIEALETQGLLVKVEDNPMTVPYGDRSGVVVEPWLTDQWFVDAAPLVKEPVQAVQDGRINFVPKNWENTFFDWMRNIQPWCVSRQLWWGHQIPAWFGPDGRPFVEMTEEEAAAAATEYYGKSVELVRDPDVLDTWFSSALWPFATLGWPEKTPHLERYYPSDVLVTGFDIIFFWVARMMMLGLYFMKDVPFRTVYIHALVRDEKGQKMSKSRGNVIDPLDLIEKYGTDSLRFTLAALAAQGRDIKMSEQRVAGYRNFSTKLWNATRFCQMNACSVVADFDPRAVRQTLSQWIIGKVAQTSQQVRTSVESYRFNDAAGCLYHFVWGTFCDWYLELAKPILNGPEGDDKKEIQATTAWVLDQILIHLHPFMPFITERLWQELAAREECLALQKWPDYSSLVYVQAKEELDWVVDLVSAIRSVRSEMNVPPSVRAPLIVHEASASIKARLETHGRLIQSLARLEDVQLGGVSVQSAGSVRIVVGDCVAMLPLAGLVDLDAEKRRLTKEIDKLTGEIMKLSQKLENKNFVSKARPDVVEEQRVRMAEQKTVKAKMEEALRSLA